MAQRKANRRHNDPKTVQNKVAATTPLLMAMGGLLFLAYVFNFHDVHSILDGGFSQANSNLQSHHDQVVSAVLGWAPLAALAIVAAVVYGISLFALGCISRWRQKRGRRDREVLSCEEFVALTASHGVSDKVAARAYELLLPHYHQQMRTRLTDTLRGDLRLRANHVADLHGNLLMLSDRKRRTDASEASLHTVLELLLEVESSPSQFVAVRESGVAHRAVKPVATAAAVPVVATVSTTVHVRPARTVAPVRRQLRPSPFVAAAR